MGWRKGRKMTTDTRREWGWWVGGALLVALVAAAALLASRPAPTFDPSTPEGTVQAFLQAVFDGETETASAYLAPDLDARCLDDRYRDPDTSVRANLVSTEANDGTAEVAIRLTFTRPEPPFGGSEYSEDVVYRLGSHSGRWLIESAGWPYSCIERIPEP